MFGVWLKFDLAGLSQVYLGCSVSSVLAPGGPCPTSLISVRESPKLGFKGLDRDKLPFIPSLLSPSSLLTPAFSCLRLTDCQQSPQTRRQEATARTTSLQLNKVQLSKRWIASSQTSHNCRQQHTNYYNKATQNKQIYSPSHEKCVKQRNYQ